MTNSELLEYSREHVFHEIEMLFDSAQLLAHFDHSKRDTDPVSHVIGNALVESFAIHLRNLTDFLYPRPSGKPSDVLAKDFCSQDVSVGLPSIGAQLDGARRKADKQVSHLTSERLPARDPGKRWHYLDLAEQIRVRLVHFVNCADSNRLHPRVVDFVRALRAPSPAHSTVTMSAQSTVSMTNLK